MRPIFNLGVNNPVYKTACVPKFFPCLIVSESTIHWLCCFFERTPVLSTGAENCIFSWVTKRKAVDKVWMLSRCFTIHQFSYWVNAPGPSALQQPAYFGHSEWSVLWIFWMERTLDILSSLLAKKGDPPLLRFWGRRNRNLPQLQQEAAPTDIATEQRNE